MLKQPNVSVELFKISFLPFKKSLKIFAAPLFTDNVLLLFNYIRFLTSLYKGLSKFRRCHFILLQTRKSDIKSKGSYSNLKVILKGNYSKYIKNLRSAVFVLSIMKCRDEQVECWPYYRIYIFTRRTQRYIQQLHAMFKPMKA